MGLFGAGSDGSPPSNPGLPAGTWGSQHLLRVGLWRGPGGVCRGVCRGGGGSVGEVRADPPSRRGGRGKGEVGARAMHMCSWWCIAHSLRHKNRRSHVTGETGYIANVCVSNGNMRRGQISRGRIMRFGRDAVQVGGLEHPEQPRRVVVVGETPQGHQRIGESSEPARGEAAGVRAAARRVRGACAGSSSPRQWYRSEKVTLKGGDECRLS